MSIDVPLSLKYRPQKLSEVIGQPVVVRAFTNAFASKSLHYAYILAGKFGCGKTTVARIIAAMENCTNSSGKDPCGKCNNCKQIFAGKHHEILEIDAASNRSIDDIRNIHKGLYQSPIECITKYVILDEAHALTAHAVQASLKMLEEPPPYAKFLLCTTEPQNIIETIHSRCILWKFNRVSWQEIYEHLKKIAIAEGLIDRCEDNALKLAARNAQGSVRNGLQNLQTIINLVGEEEIDLKSAREALGAVSEKAYFDLMTGIYKQDSYLYFKTIHEIFKDGKEAHHIVKNLFAHLDSLLKAKLCPEKLEEFSYTEEETKRYVHQAQQMSAGFILKMADYASIVCRNLDYSITPSDLFDMFAGKAAESLRLAKKRQ